MDALIGQTVDGRYVIKRLLARGGMGQIYACEQIPLGRTVALKVLQAAHVGPKHIARLQKRFFLEASTYAKLRHPNTVTIYDYGQMPDPAGGEPLLYMTMEYIDGIPLHKALRLGPFTPERALRVAREIARSLSEAHAIGFVHRDLKPSNIMLVQTDIGESVKVLDFGIVKVLNAEFGITRENSIVGTPRYMAPEQIREGTVDGRSDIYSLGVVLYEMLGGIPPFAAAASTKELLAHLNAPVPSFLERTGVVVPTAVQGLVFQCLSKRPWDRFPDADTLREAIDALLPEVAGLPAAKASSDVLERVVPATKPSEPRPPESEDDSPPPSAPPSREPPPPPPSLEQKKSRRRGGWSAALALGGGFLFGALALGVLAVLIAVGWMVAGA